MRLDKTNSKMQVSFSINQAMPLKGLAEEEEEEEEEKGAMWRRMGGCVWGVNYTPLPTNEDHSHGGITSQSGHVNSQ